VEKRKISKQMLDTMDLEQERGITIKLTPARMQYQDYTLNLIDTPGHVDFAYEVSRSLAAVEGAILLVDASQGIQAQTVANTYAAVEHNLTIIPVLNKIDLPAARPAEIADEINQTFGFKAKEIIQVSAKTGQNIDQLLEKIINQFPAPKGDPQKPTQALIFDSKYDPYLGVIAFVRVVNGQIHKNDTIKLISSNHKTQISQIGHLLPGYLPKDQLYTGEIGYIATGLKSVTECRVGDTITIANNPSPTALPGYKDIPPKVFAGIYCEEGQEYSELKDAVEKLGLNDASFTFEPEMSAALGPGFRCGFLGLLHIEIIKERLKREFNLDVILTTPTVNYTIKKSNGQIVTIKNPGEMPDPSEIIEISEPWTKTEIITPNQYIGNIMEITKKHRGIYKDTQFMGKDRSMLVFEIPLSELITDYYDQLKSTTQGYGSMNYEIFANRPGDLIKLNILVNSEPVESLAIITDRQKAESMGRQIVSKLKEIIPRQMIKIPIQAAIGSKIIARETIPAMRKDVTGYLYGGDVTRKRKLLEKQKKGKKKMESLGKVEIPKDAFIQIIKRET
ncbi:translation elongation factor 4, partial [Patescibacteria group bacterium]|nr:translation elongation factor 4 [Patescibacteria group bacterium]